MANKEMNLNGTSGENHEIGRDLYYKDQKYNQDNNNRNRYGYRGENDRRWSEGNFFHTGPSPRGAQDRHNDNDYRRGGASNSSYNQGQNAHLNDHYGSRSGSAYRNERSYINHGDRGNNQYQHDERHSMRRPHTPGGALESNQGNHNDLNHYNSDPWREGPGTGSRYKEDDYRYGSGSHNWYRENRYTPDNDNDRRYNDGSRDDRGFVDRVKDTWNDIWHSDDRDYHARNRNDFSENRDRNSTRERHGSESYRNRNFDRGLESGPRWADEVDSGHDNYYNNIDRDQRYRR